MLKLKPYTLYLYQFSDTYNVNVKPTSGVKFNVGFYHFRNSSFVMQMTEFNYEFKTFFTASVHLYHANISLTLLN